MCNFLIKTFSIYTPIITVVSVSVQNMAPWSHLTCVIIITPPSRLEPPSATKPGKSGEKQTKLQPWSAYIMCRRWRNIRLGTLVCLRHGKCAALKLHTRAETQHLS